MGFSTRLQLLVAVVGFALTGWANAQQRTTAASKAAQLNADPVQPVPINIVPTAIESLFSPQFAPTNRTMGLMQRSFVDLAESAGPQLQVALVIDGTESMAGDLQALKRSLLRLMDDIRLFKGADVAFQLVVFRDSGVAPRHVEFPLNSQGNTFTNDRDLMAKAIDRVEALSGAPYFLEAVDQGVQGALNLPWDMAETTTRWILLFGDAPPYDEGFREAETNAARRFPTEQLYAAAQAKNIKINCVLCTSRPQERDAFDKVRRKAQRFMERLANETGGKMLDMSYDDIRSSIESVAKIPRVEYAPIRTITREDLELASERAKQQQRSYAEDGRVRVAVLPHLALDQMTFAPAQAEVRIATSLQNQLSEVNGFDVKSSTVVERQFRNLRDVRGIRNPDQLLQSLATVLNVDFVVWGQLKPGQEVTQVSTAFYAKQTGRRLANEVVIRTNSPMLEPKDTARLASELILTTSAITSDFRYDRVLATRLAAFRTNKGNLIRPVSTDGTGQRLLLTAYAALERSLERAVDDPRGKRELEDAEQALVQATASSEASSPFAQYLLGSCYFNQAQRLLQLGSENAAAAKTRAYIRAINNANRSARNARTEHLRREIQGDYKLLVRKDVAGAIEDYQSLVQAPDSPMNSALRGHWMLAGIYMGDWGVAEEHVDLSKARQHAIEIMSHWPESREAKFFYQALKWNGAEGKTRFGYLPKQNTPVANLIES